MEKVRPNRLWSAMLAVSTLCTFQIANPVSAEPVYSSTSDTVFDLIREADPSQFDCVVEDGTEVMALWDKRIDAEPKVNAYRFTVYMRDQQAPMRFAVNPEFVTLSEARRQVEIVAQALGRTPLVVRRGIRQVGIHKGTPTFSAGPGKIFVYAERIQRRLSQKRLEESLFHEAVHASLDKEFAKSVQWQSAQEADAAFLTKYAADFPEREDLAETALFAYALIRHPDRVPPVDTQDILDQIPNRIALLKEILEESHGFGQTEENLNSRARPEACL